MKTEMTQRDKKLLIFLALFVIVVGIGYWGIRPQVKNIMQYNDDIEEAENEKMITEMKISQFPMLEAENEVLEQDILKARTNFYPMMTSDEIDKMITGMVLDYDLHSYELDITMPREEVDFEAYQYSKKILEPEVSEDFDIVDENGSSEDAEDSEMEFDEAETSTGIYMAQVKLRVGGNTANLQRIINDLSVSDKKHLIERYNWEKSSNNNVIFNGSEYEVQVTFDEYIYLTLDLFMCQE